MIANEKHNAIISLSLLFSDLVITLIVQPIKSLLRDKFSNSIYFFFFFLLTKPKAPKPNKPIKEVGSGVET